MFGVTCWQALVIYSVKLGCEDEMQIEKENDEG
jgi:hypothetical protein